jgi:SPP1 family phage portal protein
VPIVMNKIPKLLETLDPTAAKAQAAEWITENAAFLRTAIDRHKEWIADAEVEKYQEAYDGYLDAIEKRDKDRDDGINHKLQVNYAQTIIDTVVDYLLGKSPVWTVEADQDEDKPSDEILEAYRKDIVKLLRSEDAKRVLSEQLRQGSIAGYSAALVWVNEFGEIDFDEFPVQEMFPIFDTKGRIRLMIRYYTVESDDPVAVGNDPTKVEIYDARYITYAITDDTGQGFQLDEDELETGNPIEHKAGRVPGSLFINGTPARYEKRKIKAGSSDLGNGVYSLLEALAHALSDKANSVDRLLDQFLLLTNVDTDKKEVSRMRKTRSIVLKSKESKAQFLSQSQDDNAVQNFKNDLKEAIYDMTNTPRLNDISGATATEIKMRYAPLDIKASKKETYFMSAIKQLGAVLTDMLNYKRLVEAGVSDPYAVLQGTTDSAVELYKAHWLQPGLNRNLPQNNKEIAEIVQMLYDKVPDTFLYELLWFADDPKQMLKDMVAQRKDRAEAAATASAASLFGSSEFASTQQQTKTEEGDDKGGANND